MARNIHSVPKRISRETKKLEQECIKTEPRIFMKTKNILIEDKK